MNNIVDLDFRTFDDIVLPFDKLHYVGFAKLKGDVHCVFMEYKNVEIDNFIDVEVNLLEDSFIVTFCDNRDITYNHKTTTLDESGFWKIANRMTYIGKSYLIENGLYLLVNYDMDNHIPRPRRPKVVEEV